MSQMTPCDWINEIYSNYWGDLFTRIATRKYARILDAEQLMEDSRQQLGITLSNRCKNPKEAGKTLSAAYISATFKSRMIDVVRSRQGKPTPRKWLLAHGEIGSLLFELICLLHLSIAEILGDSEASTADPLIMETPRELVLYIVNEIQHQRECDRWERNEVSIHAGDDDDSPAIDLAAELGDPQQAESGLEITERIINILLWGGLSPGHGNIRAFAEQMAAYREEFGSKVQLSDEQVFILRARYLEDISDESAAKVVGMTVRSLRYERKKALDTLKLLVAKCDIELPE